jgi:hypothetical protein
VHICKKCNKEVEKPKTRLWRKYCPSGHRLLRDAIVQSYWGSFVRAFGITMFVLQWALMLMAMNHNSAASAGETRECVKIVLYVFGFVLFIAFLNGFLAFREGRGWKKRGGAVDKLIPRARGRGYGCVWAAGLMTLYLVPGLWLVSRS